MNQKAAIRNTPVAGATQALIPRGVADYFWAEAYARRQLEGDLLELFRRWGYQDVITPLFEYAATFEHRASPRLQSEMYRFLDRDGSTLALRADMTIPVARLVGVRLHDRPMPQRYCYAGSVFRYTEPQAGRQREFTQVGFELIGASSVAADAEVIALTVHAIRTAGIADFRLVLGQISYFDALLRELQLTPEQTEHLKRAVDRNSEAELAEFLRTTPLHNHQRHTIERLPQLSGADASGIIDQADRLSLNYGMHKALANLRGIVTELEAHGVGDAVYLDLTEINNLGYYTGISFEVLVPGLGFAVGSGGRYDNLLESFGRPRPAVGVALGIDRLLAARRATTDDAGTKLGMVDIYVAGANDATCFAIIQRWRDQGTRVAVVLDEVAPDAADNASLWHAVQQQSGRSLAVWDGNGFDVYGIGSTPAQPQHVPLDAAAHLPERLQSIPAAQPNGYA